MRSRTRLLLDVGLAAGLVAAYKPGVTGIGSHQVLGFALVVPLVVHVVLNWEWALRVARTFRERALSAMHARFLLNSAFFAAAVAVTVSGIMISSIVPSAARQASSLAWHALHHYSAMATIVLLAAHAALHLRWMAATTRRLLSAPRPVRGRTRPGASAPALAPVPAHALTRAGSAGSRRKRDRRNRAAEAARERALVGRFASVLGTACALAAVILACVGTISPAFCPPPGRKTTAVASAGAAGAKSVPAPKTVATDTKVLAKKRTATRGEPRSAASKGSGTPTAASSGSTRVPKKSAPARRKPSVASVTLTCPGTGCTASTCHGSNGQSAREWYKTHR